MRPPDRQATSSSFFQIDFIMRTPSNSNSLPLWSLSQVQERIDRGQLLVLYEDLILDLTNWIRFHPGGDLPLRHMIGE